MTERSEYAKDDPLSMVITYLEKANKDALASQVLDVFAETARGMEQIGRAHV